MGTMDVQMPDGTLVQGVPEGTTRAQLMDKLKTKDQKDKGVTSPHEAPAVSKFDKSPAGEATSWAGGALDVARSVGSTVGSDIMGGLAGVGQVVNNEMGMFQQDPVSVIRAWQKHAYPVETDKGKKIADIASIPGRAITKLEKSIGFTGEKLGEAQFQSDPSSPMLATAAELMPDAVNMIVGAKAPAAMKAYAERGAAEVAMDAVRNQNKTAAMRTSRQNGLKVSPSEYGGPVGRTITSMSNRAEVEREISADNNGRLVDMFKTNFNLPEVVPVDRGTFASVRAQLGAPYDKARALPNMTIDAPYMQDIFNAGAKFDQLTADFKEPELLQLEQRIASLRGTYMQPQWSANSAVNAMQYLRENSSDLLRSESAVDRKLGFVQREISNAIEDRLYRHATASGQPEMASEFQEARKKLAQLHVWEDAADLDKGYFSARSLVAQRKMASGKVDPYTDELKIVTDAAGAFPRSFQDIQKGTMPVSVFERYMIIGGALGAAFGAGEGSMATAATAAGIAGSGIAGRAAMTSDWYQGMMKQPSAGAGNSVMQAAGGPAGQAAGAVAGAESNP